MADVGDVGVSKHSLFIALKTTVEGLLANRSTNVWNTYGGLPRLCQDIEDILQHKLMQNQSNCADYWYFVRSLRWLNPVLAPSIEKINRLTDSGGGSSRGQVWLKQSLLNYDLAPQLKTLVDNRQHLLDFYSADAFLCNKDYFQALFICLEAVEQNKPALLAEISPKLLRHKKVSHARSSSLPINAMRRLSQDPSAPVFSISPKSPCEITTSGEHARPHSSGSSPGNEGGRSAKEALLSVLAKTENGVDSIEKDDYDIYQNIPNDPLMDMQFSPPDSHFLLDIHGSQETPDLNRHSVKRRPRTGGHNGTRKSLKKHDKVVKSNSSPAFTRHDKVVESNSSPAFSRQTSEASVILDNILNEEESDNDECDGRNNLNENIKNMGDNSSNNAKCDGNNSGSKKKTSHVRSRSDMSMIKRDVEDSQSDSTLKNADVLASSCPTDSAIRRPSFLDEGGSGIQQATECYFPRPAQGQSLLSFLSQQDFNTCAELDKENAHFSICEALIAATELMKWNQVLRPTVVYEEEEDSDDEIQELKQRIRIRRHEKMKEQARNFPAFSDGRTDTNTTSTSPLSSLHESSAFSDDVSDDSLDENTIEIEVSPQGPDSNLTTLRESGLSLSMGSMYSEAEIKKSNATIDRQSSVTESNTLSAESVAISLLKKFHEKHLPKASDLEWLVSEEDAPQTLLPLPNSFPVSPDDSENYDLTRRHTRLRGNMEWAPPRAQIIFNIHPSHKRVHVMTRQNYRCAGCGTKVERGFAKRFRYCEYLGKYFCQCCHSNSDACIPARIIQKWDFTKCYISNFARDLLERMHDDPLFNMMDLNAGLYRKVKTLDQVKECRIQLYHFRTFLRTCRNGQSMLAEMNRFPGHAISEPHVYSMADFEQIKNNVLLPRLKTLVGDCMTHVKQCQLCQVKGFICEVCHKDSIIYPWELGKVSQCNVCRSCYHKSCFSPDKCPKCARVEARRLRMASNSSPEDNTHR